MAIRWPPMSGVVGLLGGSGWFEEPRLGDARFPERAERGAVERELRHARRARPHLDRGFCGERQRLAALVDLPGLARGGIHLAVDPDLDPGRAAVDRHD